MNNQGEGPKIAPGQLPPTVNLDGSKVRQIREAKGLTQLYVATAVGVTTDTISRWENKRYPTVKRENALKLAQILEVDISEILEDVANGTGNNLSQGAEPTKNTSAKGDVESVEIDSQILAPEGKDLPSPSKKRYFIFSLLLLLLTITALGIYLYLKPRQEALKITASRFLPDHCAPGQVFPVVIDVYVKPSKQRTLLVKDGDHQGIEFIKGIPHFTSRNGLYVKWIFQGELGYTKFIYLARINKNAVDGDEFTFHGQITVKEDKKHSIPIEGNNLISAMPFSWADSNKDNIIDDEEILEAYDLLSGIKDAEKTLHEVEVLWSAGSYRWDMKKKRFQPVQKAMASEEANDQK